MATGGGGRGRAGEAAGEGPGVPTRLMGAQYIRGVMFRTVESPQLHLQPPVRPNTSMTIDVTARQIAENQPDFEIDIVMNCAGRADIPADGSEPLTLFEAQITYSGLFSLRNATTENLEMLLLVEAPKMLFPAARNYLADITREAGFLPVILQHVDFYALWQSRNVQSTQAAE